MFNILDQYNYIYVCIYLFFVGKFICDIYMCGYLVGNSYNPSMCLLDMHIHVCMYKPLGHSIQCVGGCGGCVPFVLKKYFLCRLFSLSVWV